MHGRVDFFTSTTKCCTFQRERMSFFSPSRLTLVRTSCSAARCCVLIVTKKNIEWRKDAPIKYYHRENKIQMHKRRDDNMISTFVKLYILCHHQHQQQLLSSVEADSVLFIYSSVIHQLFIWYLWFVAHLLKWIIYWRENREENTVERSFFSLSSFVKNTVRTNMTCFRFILTK